MPFPAAKSAEELDFAAPSGEELCIQYRAGCGKEGKGWEGGERRGEERGDNRHGEKGEGNKGKGWDGVGRGRTYFSGSSCGELSCILLHPPTGIF